MTHVRTSTRESTTPQSRLWRASSPKTGELFRAFWTQNRQLSIVNSQLSILNYQLNRRSAQIAPAHGFRDVARIHRLLGQVVDTRRVESQMQRMDGPVRRVDGRKYVE